MFNHHRHPMRTLIAVTALTASAAPCLAVLNVVSVSPANHALTAPRATTISIEFDQPVNPATINFNSFRVFGRWSGPVRGDFSFSPDSRTVTLTPDAPFSAGEQVMITLSHHIQSAGGEALRPSGHGAIFWTKAGAAGFDYEETQFMSVRTGGQTRLYGGTATDLDNDGWLDLSLVNEVSADVRVLMNNADGAATFSAVVQPVNPIDGDGSPNEPADFNNDGNADLCVACPSSNSVSILLGDGVGGYAPQQIVDVGTEPHGICAIDVDGDGDHDIVNSNTISNNMSLLRNNGAGIFGTPEFFESGGFREYGVCACDMNEDGLLDLVIGTRDGAEVVVMLNNGAGAFTNFITRSGAGNVWQINAADLNGDGHADVATSNSNSNTGSILFGDGTGSVGVPTNYPTSSGVVATDVGDLDGDGDLDWVLSHFGGGEWRIFENDGAGLFTLREIFEAPSNASCAILLDADNDTDLDLCLTDEIADTITIMRNTANPSAADLNGDGVVNSADLAQLLGAWGPCPTPPAPCPADLNGDNSVNSGDLAAMLGSWG